MAEIFELLESPIDGNNIIDASAGTGKTYSIEGIYIRFLLRSFLEHLEDGKKHSSLRVENILVVTFTEAATAELKTRILAKIRKTLSGVELAQEYAGKTEEELKAAINNQLDLDDFLTKLTLELFKNSNKQTLNTIEDTLKLALFSFDEASIYTIHGFCRKMLVDFALESKTEFNAEFLTDQSELLEETANDFWRNNAYHSSKQWAVFFLSLFPSPEHIISFLSVAADKSDVSIIPEAPETEPDLVGKIKSDFQSLKDDWATNKEEIQELFLTNFFKNFKKSFQGLLNDNLDRLDTYFTQNHFTQGISILSVFNNEGIVSGTSTSKGVLKDTPSHWFLEKLNRFSVLTSKPSLLAGAMPALNRILEKKKKQAGLLTFDDLLSNLRNALVAEKGEQLAEKIRSRFQAALIDEFQDTDPIQYEIFKRIFHNQRPLFFIGDPKQSIYQFRGADIFAYFKAVQDTTRKSHLDTNYRSDCKLIDAVNTIFTPLKNDKGEELSSPFVYGEKIPFLPSQSGRKKDEASIFKINGKAEKPLKFWFLKSDTPIKAGDAKSRIMSSTVSEIVRLLNLGEQGKATIPGKDSEQPVQPRHIAILVLSHASAQEFQQELRKANVPSVIRSKRTIFNSDEFTEVRYLLAGIYQYNRDEEIKAALLTEFFDYSGTEVYQLAKEEQKFEKIIRTFRKYHEIWSEQGFYSMIRLFMKEESTRQKMLQFEEGERKLTNYLQIFELLHKAETEKQMNPMNLIRWIDQACKNENDEDEHQLRLETDEDALKILTVHVSKGLEFPIVFCPFSWSTRKHPDHIFFHDTEKDDRLTWDLLKNDLSKSLEAREALAEKVRLAYVAFTRARHACYIAWGNINATKTSCYGPLFHPAIKDIDKANKEDSGILWKDLQALESRSDGSIELTEMPESSALKFVTKETILSTVDHRRFESSLNRDWGVYSFTMLSQMGAHQFEEDDPKEPLEDAESLEESPVETQGILTFPGGAKTGNFFHEIMEDTDFASISEAQIHSLVESKLQKYNFETEFKPLVIEVVEKVRNLEVTSDYQQNPPFSFKQIDNSQIIKEMEFFFPVNGLSLKKFISVVEKYNDTPLHQSLLNTLRSLSFHELKGYFKGFIDMVFCVGGRYYILDWKTNKLGDHASDYHKNHLQKQIEEHKFNLQYTLYSLALHKYLSKRMGPHYQFEKHFGGVYYFFLRGIDPAFPDHGVYYESLASSKAMFEELGTFFKGEAE